MTDASPFPPRQGDLPREELIKQAEQAVSQWPGKVQVLFKFTCPYCGERCTLQEPNVLYENGECFSCGKTSPIEFGGFSIMSKLG